MMNNEGVGWVVLGYHLGCLHIGDDHELLDYLLCIEPTGNFVPDRPLILIQLELNLIIIKHLKNQPPPPRRQSQPPQPAYLGLQLLILPLGTLVQPPKPPIPHLPLNNPLRLLICQLEPTRDYILLHPTAQHAPLLVHAHKHTESQSTHPWVQRADSD